MRLTDLTKVDKHTRDWRKAITMLETLQRRMDYYHKNTPTLLNQGHTRRFIEIRDLLRQQIQNSPDLIDNQLISQASESGFYDELFTIRVKQKPAEHEAIGILTNKPVSITMDYTFTNLPKPHAAQQDELTAAMVELMHNKGKDARAQQHQFNLNAEIAYRTHNNWYLLFNTLTVQQGSYNVVFNKNSHEFKNYIRSFERQITEAETGSRNTPQQSKRTGNTNHSYFACVEEGGIGGRLHIHVLHFFRTLPNYWHDPNRGRLHPNLRELPRVKSLWKHGYSTPIAVRYSPKDAYGLTGWRWPYDNKSQNSLQIGTPLKLGSYMSKYIIKGYTSCKRSKLLWRVRKSQKLGTAIIEELLSTLTPTSLLLLSMEETLKLKFNNQLIPPTLLRQTALQRYQNLQSTKQYNALPTLRNMAEQVTPRPSLLQSLKGSSQTTQLSNQRSTIISLTKQCSPEDISNFWEQIYVARKTIDDKYYRRSFSNPGTTSTADYIAAKDTAFAQTHAAQAANRSNP